MTEFFFTEMSYKYYFEVQILKAYRKPFTRLVEEGTFISSHEGELLNSKSEWHQAKIVRTTTKVIQGGAEVLRQEGHAGGGGEGRRHGGSGGGGQHQGGRGGGGQPLGGRVVTARTQGQ